MPKQLHRLAKRMEKSMPESRAWALATWQLQKKGVLKKGSNKLARGGRKS